MKKNLTSSVKKCKPKQRDILIYHNSKWCEEMDVGSINLYSLSLQFDSICGKVWNAFSFDFGIPLPEICSKKIIGHMQKGINVSIFTATLFLKWHCVDNVLLPGFCVEGQPLL